MPEQGCPHRALSTHRAVEVDDEADLGRPRTDVVALTQEAILRCARDESSPYVIEFLLLTACRANEVIRMPFSEVDFRAKLWIVPATRTKVVREHRVPLSDRALELLAERRLRTNSNYVWQSHRIPMQC